MNFGSRVAYVSASMAPPRQEKEHGRRQRFLPQEPAAATNVIRVDLGTLKEIHVATGDPVICGHCNGEETKAPAISVFLCPPLLFSLCKCSLSRPAAVMSHLSKVRKEEGGDTYQWPCEFCGAKNTGLKLEPEELPSAMAAPAACSSSPGSSKGVDFLLVPPPGPASSDAGSTAATAAAAGADESAVIFLMDCSGSMCITSELSGAAAAKLKLRGAAERAAEFDALRTAGDDFGDGGGAGFGTRHRVGGGGGGGGAGSQYVSRLQALQAAITSQLESLSKTKPGKRVGVISFASEVTVFGDCSAEPVVLAGSCLNDFDALLSAGETTCRATLTKPIADCRKKMSDKVWSIKEEGSTALGPALIAAIGMLHLGNGGGGKIIVCTDGLANTGLASLEAPDLPKGSSPEAKQQAAEQVKQQANEVFTRIQALALETGIAINVLGFSDSNCNLEALSKLSDATGGNLNRVDVKSIVDEFSSILEEEVRATNVSLTMIGHAALHVSDPTQDVVMGVSAAASGGAGDEDDEEVEEEKRPAPGSSKPKPKKATANQRQLEQVSHAWKSKARSAVPASTAAAAGVAGAGAEAAPEASSDAAVDVDVGGINAIAGLLAQRHGLKAGTVTVTVPSSAAPSSAAPCVPPAAASTAGGESKVAAPAESSPADDPFASQPRHLQPCASATTLYVGNCTDSTEATFEYRQKTAAELKRIPGLAAELDTMTSLPFQLQISFTSKDGGSYLRCITASQPITREAERALREMDAAAMTSHASRVAANLAKRGAYGASAQTAQAYQAVISSNLRADDADGAAVFQSWSIDADALTRTLKAEVASERPKAKKSAAPSRSVLPAPSASSSSSSGSVGGLAAAAAPGAPAPRGAGGSSSGFFRGIANTFGFGSSAAPVPPAPPAALSAAPMAEKDSEPFAGGGGSDDDSNDGDESAEADEKMAAARADRRAGQDQLAAQIARMAKGTRNYK